MSRIIRYGIHFSEMARKHEYMTAILFLSLIAGNLLHAGIWESLVISIIETVALFAVWRE